MSEWFREIGATRMTMIIVGAMVIFVLLFAIVSLLPIGKIQYSDISTESTSSVVANEAIASTTNINIVRHIKTPNSVKAIYMSSWAAGSQSFRSHLFDLASTTEINAVVIDIKDYTGKIGFAVDDPELQKFNATEDRIPDIKEFIKTLHDMDIYVIGRISSFQDSHLINSHPEWAVKTKSGAVWKDNKGVKWLEVGARPVWDYLVDLAKYSYSIGFDEINFDYIRFPSDGDLSTIQYEWTGGRTRPEVLREFFMYVRASMSDVDVPISADLFGLTTSATGDLGIGQVLEDALAYFDYVAPMVYPSHYGYGFNGIAKPATKPYEVIKYALEGGIEKAQRASVPPEKIRPWLQDFDLGATYTPDMVRAQIQATYDVGLDSWMLWNAGARYQKKALFGKDVVDTVADIKPLPVENAATSTATSTAN